jgi:hypothetical protein
MVSNPSLTSTQPIIADKVEYTDNSTDNVEKVERRGIPIGIENLTDKYTNSFKGEMIPQLAEFDKYKSKKDC